MRRWAVLLLLSWWVVYGYGYPPNVVSGPFMNQSQCQYVARELNRINLDVQYRCAWH